MHVHLGGDPGADPGHTVGLCFLAGLGMAQNLDRI